LGEANKQGPNMVGQDNLGTERKSLFASALFTLLGQHSIQRLGLFSESLQQLRTREADDRQLTPLLPKPQQISAAKTALLLLGCEEIDLHLHHPLGSKDFLPRPPTIVRPPLDSEVKFMDKSVLQTAALWKDSEIQTACNRDTTCQQQAKDVRAFSQAVLRLAPQ
jgi:hypothetical protein